MRCSQQRGRLTSAIFALLAMAMLSLVVGCEQPPQNNGGCGPCTRPKLIVFTASWCDPCQRDKPLVLQIEAAGVEVRVYDIDKSPDFARKCGVTAVPTYFYYECGKTIVRVNSAAEVLVLVNRWRH